MAKWAVATHKCVSLLENVMVAPATTSSKVGILILFICIVTILLNLKPYIFLRKTMAATIEWPKVVLYGDSITQVANVYTPTTTII